MRRILRKSTDSGSAEVKILFFQLYFAYITTELILFDLRFILLKMKTGRYVLIIIRLYVLHI